MEKYPVAIVKTVVDEAPENFDEIVDGAVAQLKTLLPDSIRVQLSILQFHGPHLVPAEGVYSPLDFLYIGLRVKIERQLPFLLMVTNVELSAGAEPFVLGLPSPLTNIAIISGTRLAPDFWGDEPDVAVTQRRLASLMAHMLGHLLNLDHDHDQADNVMYDFAEVEELDSMSWLRDDQVEQMRRQLPIEARQEIGRRNDPRFALAKVVANVPAIAREFLRANPVRILWNLPTMVTAAFSVAIILFFSTEIWDVATTLSPVAVILFAIISVVATTGILYRAFHLEPFRSRAGGTSEATVVAEATALASVFATVLLLYTTLFLFAFISAVTFFPEPLKETWPTADPAVDVVEQVKLGLFVASVGVLTGSLGSGAGNRQLVRQVLFLGEE